jgi:hypothetical protein
MQPPEDERIAAEVIGWDVLPSVTSSPDNGRQSLHKVQESSGQWNSGNDGVCEKRWTVNAVTLWPPRVLSELPAFRSRVERAARRELRQVFNFLL